MERWHVLSNVKQLRGFLRLTGYYRRFIKAYASISRPLTLLLKKNGFKWNDEAQQSIENLKPTMMSAPILALPDFGKEFIVKTDASRVGIGAVLIQGGYSIAYLIKTLSTKHQLMSTYEKEFLATILALERWRGYLMDRHFKIKTNHFSLKYLLDQRITTPTQMKCLPKMMGFEYEITFKKGVENVSADALSKIQNEAQLFSFMTSSPVTTELLQKNEATWKIDPELKLRRKGKLVIGNNDSLRKELLNHFHSSPVGGHVGVKATMHKMCSPFYWRKIRKEARYGVRTLEFRGYGGGSVVVRGGESGGDMMDGIENWMIVLGFDGKTCEEYELNNNMTWDLEEPWSDNEDHKWYNELDDGKLKVEALMHKAKLKNHGGMQLPENYGANNAGDTQDNQEHKKEHHDPSTFHVRRFQMIKYSFDADDEYVAIKEHECSDHSKTNIDACQAYRELFRIMDEGWLVTKACE
ncbi:putative mitochondrial protein [Tanacetum coccineum]